MIRIDDLIGKVSAYLPPDADLELLNKAYVFSAQLHRHQFDSAGYPALQHALEVSDILAELRVDVKCLAAGLLHDVLEDKLAEPAQLVEVVGEEVQQLVVELSVLSRASFHGSEAARAQHMREMILATTRDLRVILILLADRLHYLRTPSQLPAEAMVTLARETLQIYGPIANRLGIHYFKAEMEDLAFKALEPEQYEALRLGVRERMAQRQARVERINAELQTLLADHGQPAEVLGRTKHLYSIHRKMQRTGAELDEIYDLLATRLIVETHEECYKVLGLIHATYTPLPGRFKDYIALPKANGYQSLHTHVIGPTGDMFEIQIRTREMHRAADIGIAAHFLYKDGTPADDQEMASVTWFRQLLEHMESGRDPREAMELLTRDLNTEQVFLFTPRGEVIKLPLNATALDFAYAVHTDLGHRCIGAKIDGRMVSIRTPLKNGSVVDILTSSRQMPHRDWLNIAVSSKALTRIRGFLRHQDRDGAVKLGREKAEREAKRLGKKLEELLRLPEVESWMRRHNLPTPEDLFAAEGIGRISLRTVLEGLHPEWSSSGEAPRPEPAKRVPARVPGRPGGQVRVAGLDNIMVRFAKCCSAVHGDPLTGVITRGRGVSIHHRDCPNLGRHVFHHSQVVEAEWVDAERTQRPVTLVITAATSIRHLMDLTGSLEEEGMQIASERINSANGIYTQHLTLMVGNSAQIERVLQRLNATEGIRAARALDSA